MVMTIISTVGARIIFFAVEFVVFFYVKIKLHFTCTNNYTKLCNQAFDELCLFHSFFWNAIKLSSWKCLINKWDPFSWNGSKSRIKYFNKSYF